MKKLLIAVAAMVVMVSCETKVSNESGTNSTAAAEKNAEGTKKVFHALETGDVTGLDSLFTEDVIDHDAGPQGQDIKGRDSVKAMLGKMHTFFEGLKIDMMSHATSADGQYHYVTSRMTGKATAANPWGIPAGMDVDDTSVDVIKMKDGKCSEHWGFLSWKDVNEMMMGMKQGSGKPAEEKKK
jgi:ketosteroid isomerase-like protein